MTTTEPTVPEHTGPASLDAAVLRILDAAGGPVGLGFLVTDQLVLTCAHVVAAALGMKDDAPSPAGAMVGVDLPLLGSGHRATAVVERWIPAQSSGAGDVAVLRLSAPLAGARPVRLVEADQVWGHPARAYGLPDGRPGGVWHSSVLRHRQANGWVQADLVGDGYQVSPGFSGGPVWDDELAGVVGMTVAAESGQPPVSYLIPTAGLLAAWPDLRDRVAPPSPFRGLRPFFEADAASFHGRQAESDQVAQIVAGQRWTALVGPSGCGKSSLAMAGVIPRRRMAGDIPLVMRPGLHTSPLHALAAALLPLLEPDLSEMQRLTETTDLAERLAKQGLHEIVPRVLELHRADRLLIVLDQFEELLDLQSDTVDAFARVLFADDTPAAVRVLCTLRADFLEPLLAHPRLGQVVSKRVVALEPMRPDQLREIITKPVDEIPSVSYQPNLAERILADTGTGPAALPLLGFTLDLLWERQDKGVLTYHAYDEIGGVAGALGDYANRAWADNVPDQDEQVAERLLTQLARVPIGATAATRRIAPRAELGEQEWRIAQRLAATRLLVIQGGDGPETVELAHEALITGWDKLRDRIKADRSFLDWRESLGHDMTRWERGKRDPDLLPSPAMLAGANGREHDLNEDERAYVKQGRARHRTRTRHRRSLLGLLGVLILAAGATGIVSVYEQQAAAQKAAVVRSGTLAADSRDLATSDPGLAAQLAVAAYRTAPTQDAATALYGALQSPLLDNILTTSATGFVDRTATQADGPLGAAVDSSGTVRVWNLDTPATPVELTLHTAGTTGIALSPHAPLLAAACTPPSPAPTGPANSPPHRPGPAPGLCLWNLTGPAHPAIDAHLPTPIHGRFGVSSMAISPDGTLLAAASESGFTLLWSIAEPTHPRLLADLPNPTTAHTGQLASVAFAPTGGVLADSIERGATHLWSIANPAAPTSLTTINSGYQNITINPAGTMLAGANDNSLDLWNISRPAAPTQINYEGTGVASDEDIQALSISPDGHTLAFGGTAVDNGNAGLCLLDLTSDAQNPATGPICMSTGFSTDTMTYTHSGALLTGGLDSTVRLWRASPAVIADANPYDFVAPLAVSADGHRMAAAISPTSEGAPAIAGIWNLNAPAGPTLEAALPASSASVGATFVDTNLVLTVAKDGNVQLWNIADLHHPRQTASLGTASSAIFGIHNITFNPARDIVGVLGDGGVLNLWHVTGTGTATLIGSLTDPAATNDIGGILQEGNTAFMPTPTGIDWWNTSNPAHPVETNSTPLPKPKAFHQSINDTYGNATTLFAAATPPDPAGGGATLNLYNVDDGHVQSTATVSRHTGQVLALSIDGHRLAATGTFGNELTIWDTADAHTPKRATSVLVPVDISGVAFSDDNDLMADWNLQTVQLWDIHDPHAPVLMGSFSPTNSYLGSNVNETISAANFTPDGKLLITVEGAGPSLAYLFNTNAQHAADQLCSITTTPITTAQWEQYTPGIPYKNPCPS